MTYHPIEKLLETISGAAKDRNWIAEIESKHRTDDLQDPLDPTIIHSLKTVITITILGHRKEGRDVADDKRPCENCGRGVGMLSEASTTTDGVLLCGRCRKGLEATG